MRTTYVYTILYQVVFGSIRSGNPGRCGTLEFVGPTRTIDVVALPENLQLALNNLDTPESRET